MRRWAYVILSFVLPIDLSTGREKICERGRGMLQKEVVKCPRHGNHHVHVLGLPLQLLMPCLLFPCMCYITKRELAELRRTTMNKQLCALVSCVLMLALHLPREAPVNTSASSRSPTPEEQSPGRKLLKEPGLSAATTEMIQRMKEPKRGHEEEEGHIYNADYSLVATHPPPLPKRHPKP
ncbi:hypothetical protein MUK42_06363 [Musa troglodytarum]|uniref:Uncharacterized protein n=2 Tax=Musa troglodytarum TaxID=320322 RepID=A0A9E7KSL6_9LILI|nr:hypothetical protein MUK42_06363 [Musa troglodytarum]